MTLSDVADRLMVVLATTTSPAFEADRSPKPVTPRQQPLHLPRGSGHTHGWRWRCRRRLSWTIAIVVFG